ncbi:MULTISPECIES: hypothetical protein [unclassified Haematospirillum]|uniref:hypothetical protein n=1 Tax=unclassified Haematospirillum TaxID=2622088 RepID=UPI001438D2CA|nr:MULTISPECIES: hypothetical protein [unclassified Haematospirillum]NKD55198.1 hypothetical protein [Haematospirillum sp. H4890]NKD75083.1 hypothetical protein [Haematospirillum sp. H4485]NKD87373.1 hypothetical protein [Haematospirillum sp. 15-248]
MAFERCNLSVLSYANGFTQWHYRTKDTTLATGYFNSVADMLRKGDLMVVNLDDENTRTVALYRVQDAGRSGVTVTALS